MANWKAGLGGAASGAGTGAAIGSAFGPEGTAIGAGVGFIGGGLAGLFGGGDDDQLQANIKMWQDAIDAYQNDPTNKDALAKIQALTSAGLTDQEKAELLHASTDAGNFAHSMEGAVALKQAQRGGGVSTSGLTPGMEDQAAQAAGQRYATQAQDAAGQASQRRQAATYAYANELDRQQQILNMMRGGLAGARTGEQDYNEQNSAAMLKGIAQGAQSGGAAALYTRMNTPGAEGGYWPQLPNSPVPQPPGSNPYDFSSYLYGTPNRTGGAVRSAY